MILKVLAVIFIVFFLILIHEFGHYIVAKRNGVKVHEFAIGFAPFVFSFSKFDTLFKIGLLPLGGYVKLHGEDTSDKKLAQDPQSFASKTPWQKTKIICAGVFMNFLVFWVLLTSNLIVGSEPMVLNQEDFQRHINSEQTVLYHASNLLESETNKDLVTISSFENTNGPKETLSSLSSVDVDSYPKVSLPVLNVLDVYNQSSLFGEVEKGDKIIKVSDQIVFTHSQLSELLNSEVYSLDVLRNGEVFKLSLSQNPKLHIVSQVVENSPAFDAGVEPGFRLVAIEGLDDISVENLSQKVLDLLKQYNKDYLLYSFLDSDSNIVELELRPSSSGTVGMYLSQAQNSSGLGLSYAFDREEFSVIQKPIEKYSWHIAPLVALSQGFELSKLTAVSISQTFFKIFTSLEVSDQVGGPIQVFKTGYSFVNIGGTALIGFIAMISLTLAVVNILPIPALDGGRLLFVVIEAFRGKPLDPRFESALHALGFFMLLFLIIIISFFDIIRL